MIELPFWFWIAAAVLLFWAVGAYNRLVRLRGDIQHSFAGVEAHIRQRADLLAAWLTAAADSLGASAHSVDALRGACVQVLAAVNHARTAPGTAQAIASLRLAEEVLIGARGRLSTELAGHNKLNPEWHTVLQADELAAVDVSLGFARLQFNDKVQRYNAAAAQFPTWLIAGLFGFSAAGLL